MMRYGMPVLLALAGALIGIVGTLVFANPVPILPHLHPHPVLASGSNDRYQDYIMCTGAVAVTPRSPTDGVWMLDYKSGKLLGTVIDRTVGRIIGWAEVDLVAEFNIPPKQDVHF